MSLKARLRGKSHGTDGKKAADRIERLETALKVIYTWCGHDYSFDKDNIRRLCAQELRMENHE